MTRTQTGFTLAELAERFGGEVQGDGAIRVHQVASIEQAGEGDITFLSNPKYASKLSQTAAGAVIVSPQAVKEYAGPAILTPTPYTYFARVAQLFNPPEAPLPGVHATAVVESGVPPSASVGAQVVIGPNVKIGDGVVIAPGCVIGEGVTLGAGTRLFPRVTIYPHCVVGERCVIHSGVVIGADGFGFAREADGAWLKIPQIGRVVIGHEVEIGANTTIDRGALDDTVIEDGVILDNQIQIGHNVHIGARTAVAGCVGIAGSTHIGARCMIGGAAMIIGHLSIADDVTVSSCTMVTKSIASPGVITGTLPQQSHDEWLKNFAQLRHLSSLAEKLRALEQRVASMEKAS